MHDTSTNSSMRYLRYSEIKLLNNLEYCFAELCDPYPNILHQDFCFSSSIHNTKFLSALQWPVREVTGKFVLPTIGRAAYQHTVHKLVISAKSQRSCIFGINIPNTHNIPTGNDDRTILCGSLETKWNCYLGLFGQVPPTWYALIQ